MRRKQQEAVPNPMIGKRRRQFFVQISIWIFAPYQGLFAQIQVEHQINPVLEVLFTFCTRCHQWRAYRVASAAVFSDGPKSSSILHTLSKLDISLVKEYQII
jgi:hypothetical protein